jgi:hypothetical protein
MPYTRAAEGRRVGAEQFHDIGHRRFSFCKRMLRMYVIILPPQLRDNASGTSRGARSAPRFRPESGSTLTAASGFADNARRGISGETAAQRAHRAPVPVPPADELLAGIVPTATAPIVMSVGEPQDAPPALLAEAVAANASLWNRYPPAAGTPEFRLAVQGVSGTPLSRHARPD